jgi:hypothetical protein
MSYKKVGIAQDSNLRGDSVRVQNPTNTFAYAEFSYDGSATYSVKYPSTSGQAGNALVLVSPNEYEWGTGVGSAGATGTSGSSGSSGSSGTSGANGVGGATMLGQTNFVSKYVGATALGTASVTSVGEQLRFPDGTNAAPAFAFANDADTGIYRVSANRMAIAAGGATSAIIDDAQFAFKNGSQSFPGFTIIGDSNTGLNSPSADRLSVITGGQNAAIFGSTNSIANQTFFNKAVNHTPVTNLSVSGTYTMDMSSSNIFILTLTASTTLDYSNAQVGSYVIVVSQNAVGGYALNLATSKFIGATSLSIGLSSNSKSLIQLIYDGSSAILMSQKNLVSI